MISPGRHAPLLPRIARDRIALAKRHLAERDYRAAERLARSVLAAHPDFAEAHHLIALACFAGGRPGDALTHAQAAVTRSPQRADHRVVLGRVYKAVGQIDRAIVEYREALRLEPWSAAIETSLGIALKSRGALDEAIDCYRRAVSIDPGLAEAHINLGNALAERMLRRDPAEASAATLADIVAVQTRALELDPANAGVLHILGTTFMHAGDLEAASHAFNRSLGFDPSRRETCLQLATCLRRMGKPDGARACYARWLELNPASADMLANLAGSLVELGAFEDALDAAGRALSLDPDSSEALHNKAGALQQCQRLDEAVACYRRAIASRPDNLEARGGLALTLNYVEEDPQVLRLEHASYGACFERIERPAVTVPAAGRPLRVGYVSGDFRRHSVAYFFEPLLEAHDRERFVVTCYSCHFVEDDVTARIRASADAWVRCAGLSSDALAKRIVEDRIDVLVDLSGHTGESRLPVFARRPAPLQVGYLGYPTGTGLAAIDYRISDAATDSEDGGPQAGDEAVLCLPHSYFCYRPDAAPELAEPPVLSEGRITFGSFNNLAKLSAATLRLWAAVLHATPGSRLLLKTRALSQSGNRDLLLGRFKELGIVAERILLNPWQPDLLSHLDVYRAVDVALDTYPFNGATTTCEALWMGVPLVTRRGRTHASRMGASVLGAAGLAKWVTDSDQDFITRATALAADQQVLQDFRRHARVRLHASPLMDAPAFARDFEGLIHGAWMQLAGTSG